MLTQYPEQLTPRESITMEYEKERANKEMEFGLRMKELEIEAQKLDIKIGSIFRIPIFILKLPVLIILSIAYIVHIITKTEPSENFWRLLK